MLTAILTYLKKIFKQSDASSYGSELEQYIISKCPQSAAEIDYWTRQFDHRNTQRSWL